MDRYFLMLLFSYSCVWQRHVTNEANRWRVLATHDFVVCGPSYSPQLPWIHRTAVVDVIRKSIDRYASRIVS